MEALQTLAVRYASRHPADAARRLETVSSADTGTFLTELDSGAAAAVIERMSPSSVAAAFVAMDPAVLAEIAEHLPVSRWVLVLRCLANEKRDALLTLLPRKTAPQVERLLRSSTNSAGFLAGPTPAVLSPEMSVGEARGVAGRITGPYAYVVDDDHRLIGVIHRKALTTSDVRARIGNLMSTQVTRIPSAAPFSAVRNHRAWFEFDELPVVDSSGVLVGVIRHRNVRSSEPTQQTALILQRPLLDTFLELGEWYWGGLTSLVAAMGDRQTVEEPKEVNHDA